MAVQALTRFETRLKRLLDVTASEPRILCTELQPKSLGFKRETLGFVAEDARAERKDLIPLRIIDALSMPELSALKRRISASANFLHEEQFVQSAVAEQALQEVRAAEAYRVFGVYQITQYREPRLVYMLKKNKREWLPGELRAVFSLHAADGRRLCQTTLNIVNNTAGAPIRSRLRADTRERLITELVSELRQKSLAAADSLAGDAKTEAMAAR